MLVKWLFKNRFQLKYCAFQDNQDKRYGAQIDFHLIYKKSVRIKSIEIFNKQEKKYKYVKMQDMVVFDQTPPYPIEIQEKEKSNIEYKPENKYSIRLDGDDSDSHDFNMPIKIKFTDGIKIKEKKIKLISMEEWEEKQKKEGAEFATLKEVKINVGIEKTEVDIIRLKDEWEFDYTDGNNDKLKVVLPVGLIQKGRKIEAKRWMGNSKVNYYPVCKIIEKSNNGVVIVFDYGNKTEIPENCFEIIKQ